MKILSTKRFWANCEKKNSTDFSHHHPSSIFGYTKNTHVHLRRLPRWFHASGRFFGCATNSCFGKSLCVLSSAFRRPLQGLNYWEALHLNLLGYLLSLNKGDVFSVSENARKCGKMLYFWHRKKVKDFYTYNHVHLHRITLLCISIVTLKENIL